MAFFDEGENKYVVRIVYDGPARAGKTSNLRALCDIFSVSRRSAMLSPGELAESTTLFDWLRVDSGIISGCGLRSVFLTVPGQRVLARRRLALLDRADAVAYVIDATCDSLDEAAAMWAVTRERLKGRGDAAAPVVVQINKRDIPGGFGQAEVRAALELGPEVPIILASATAGMGIRETAVLVMRAASNRVQQQLLKQGKESFELSDYGADQLEADLGSLDPDVSDLLVPPLQNRSHDILLNRNMASSRENHQQKTAPLKGLPPLPTSEVEGGLLWPSHGREVLRLIEREQATFRRDLNCNPGDGDGSGGTDTMVFQAGSYCLKTSRRRITKDPEEGRLRLFALARSKARLGDLIVEGTVVSLHKGDGEEYWLWTTTPWLPTLRYLMQSAVAGQQRAELERALALYAEAILRSLELAVRSGIVLDVHPSNFVTRDAKVYYVDDDVISGTTIPTLGYSILRRVEEYAAFSDAIRSYVNLVIVGMLERVTREERTALDLHAIIRDTLVRSEAAQTAKQRILAAIQPL